MEACGWDDAFWEEIGLEDLVEGHHAKIGKLFYSPLWGPVSYLCFPVSGVVCFIDGVLSLFTFCPTSSVSF